MIDRKDTRQIRVGNVRIGGGAPVSIQSMTKVETSNVKAVVSQIKALEAAGCEIIRVAVKSEKDALAIKDIRKKINIPLVADIHFDYRLALKAIASGADKIRLNPGNINRYDEIGQVVSSAKKARIPIRIGVNSGSLPKGAWPHPKRRLAPLVGAAMRYIKLFEKLKFHDIIISLKASDVVTTIEAYREIAELCDYPMHLGVTASGPYDVGIVKSAIGIGSLLADGIGDTIRVSLTADPAEEVIAAKRILSSLNLRKFGPKILSCPTCGRCQVDLVGIVSQLDDRLKAYSLKLKAGKPLCIAIMGCEVNGPGEAMGADIGIAFGKGSGMLFRKGKILRKVAANKAVTEILKEIKRLVR